MKNRLILLTLLIIMTITVSSCSKDDDSSADPSQTQDNVQSGTWRVTLYNDSGENRTSYFEGFSFTFNTNGSLTAVNGTVTQNGTYSVYKDSGDTKFDITFQASSGPFEEISEDWRVITQSASKIELINVSGGNGGTDYLTFEKN